MMAAIEKLSILLRPGSTSSTSSDDSAEITNVLQETKGDDEVQEVKPRSSRINCRKAD